MKVNDNSAANKPSRAGTTVESAKGAAAGAPARKTSTASGSAPGGATVTMSSDVDDVSRISAAAQETPEIRPEVVEQIKEELESGKLDTNPELLAARLLQDMGWFAVAGV